MSDNPLTSMAMVRDLESIAVVLDHSNSAEAQMLSLFVCGLKRFVPHHAAGQGSRPQTGDGAARTNAPGSSFQPMAGTSSMSTQQPCSCPVLCLSGQIV